MGEISELVLVGALCQQCHSWANPKGEGLDFAPGHPRTCDDCILGALSALRLHPQAKEDAVQGAIAAALETLGVEFEREYCMGPRARIDFLCSGGTGIEVKNNKPSSAALRDQLERYAACDAVSSLIVVVATSVFDCPRELHGKPVHYVALNRNWGISL